MKIPPVYVIQDEESGELWDFRNGYPAVFIRKSDAEEYFACNIPNESSYRIVQWRGDK